MNYKFMDEAEEQLQNNEIDAHAVNVEDCGSTVVVILNDIDCNVADIKRIINEVAEKYGLCFNSYKIDF